MSDEVNRLWEQGAKELFYRKVAIEKELKDLQGKRDPASAGRFDELIDELMTVDSALGPFRKAMGNAPRKQQPEKPSEQERHSRLRRAALGQAMPFAQLDRKGKSATARRYVGIGPAPTSLGVGASLLEQGRNVQVGSRCRLGQFRPKTSHQDYRIVGVRAVHASPSPRGGLGRASSRPPFFFPSSRVSAYLTVKPFSSKPVGLLTPATILVERPFDRD
jgi:hypothetical protein